MSKNIPLQSLYLVIMSNLKQTLTRQEYKGKVFVTNTDTVLDNIYVVSETGSGSGAISKSKTNWKVDPKKKSFRIHNTGWNCAAYRGLFYSYYFRSSLIFMPLYIPGHEYRRIWNRIVFNPITTKIFKQLPYDIVCRKNRNAFDYFSPPQGLFRLYEKPSESRKSVTALWNWTFFLSALLDQRYAYRPKLNECREQPNPKCRIPALCWSCSETEEYFISLVSRRIISAVPYRRSQKGVGK